MTMTLSGPDFYPSARIPSSTDRGNSIKIAGAASAPPTASPATSGRG